ncbi:MAG: hypothetical protein NC348_10115 [Clostridium sp.]|nr:hypothetical protein [Clostridium sp.]
MSVNGIGAAYPMVGYDTRKTERNPAGGNFADQAAQVTGKTQTATLHGANEGSGDIAVSSWADVVSGVSVSVYKTPDFDLKNPIYKVKTWDKSGNVTEQMVDISKVNPKNCNTAEMYAYTENLKESGKGSFEDTVLKAAVAKAVKNAEQRNSASWSFSEKMDWVKIVKDIMQSEYNYGDLKGYMEWNKFLGFLDNQESETTSDVIVKPDGSRVLVVTMNMGGMATTMSLEISKPTDALNEAANQEVTNDEQSAISDSNLSENHITEESM